MEKTNITITNDLTTNNVQTTKNLIKNYLPINIKFLDKYSDSNIIKIPTRATSGSAGVDLVSLDQKNIYPNETVKFHTGICMEIPSGYVGIIAARSGLSINSGLAPANKIGVIDEDYRGEIIVALHNHSNEPKTVNIGDKIAQMLFIKYEVPAFNIVGELKSTVRGEGGLGSTGK